MSPAPQNTLAITLKSLHKPGNPILVTNIWDPLSATAVASLPSTAAVATASAAVAKALNLDDDALTLEQNLAAVRLIAAAVQPFNKPLTVDFQDGYAENLEQGVKELIGLGVVGINLEDFAREMSDLYPVATACERIKRVLATASALGVPDFVINARTDALVAGRELEEAIERGKAYLEAGAHTVFIWGGGKRGGMSREEVAKACEALGGRVSVKLNWIKGGLSVKELGEIGVARVSLGPELMVRSLELVKDEVGRIQRGERA
jgi:2-methylisocitrate lyase-like PEP mutase family enzyme